jgi:hypothetical protein
MAPAVPFDGAPKTLKTGLTVAPTRQVRDQMRATTWFEREAKDGRERLRVIEGDKP